MEIWPFNATPEFLLCLFLSTLPFPKIYGDNLKQYSPSMVYDTGRGCKDTVMPELKPQYVFFLIVLICVNLF